MALQVNVAVRGGLEVSSAYVRAKSITAVKVDSAWVGVIEWEGFKDATEAGKPANVRVPVPLSDIDRDKFPLTLTDGNFVAQAYAWAKANKAEFSGAQDM